MIIHSATYTKDCSLAQKFQNTYIMQNSNMVLLIKSNTKNRQVNKSGQKWKDWKYHVQDNNDVANKDVKMFCDTAQFPLL